ncbi:hypothetical protein SAMN05444064_10223 [Pseudomonas syringae]|uniref:hypothetical protein n=1 Tax=Pseudomonas syringae TaxID=317 RepID=UPI000895A777|nr:hypothetical protein [Pseudomonas syringae]SDW30302.1 hypothetical protein SAMN05444514_102387 [Pseudomonas syringae]SFL50042.1 hypothetical protein SAMN05444064_10223 [Pseudomonas syringae]
MLHTMLSLDYVNGEDTRNDFYKYLAAKNWTKRDKVDTVWTLLFDKYAQTDSDDVIKYISSTLLAAAKDFKPDEITYVAQIGNARAVSGGVAKKSGVYSSYTGS